MTVMESNGTSTTRGGYRFNELEKARALIGRNARQSALRRFIRENQARFDEIHNEERAKVGLGPKMENESISELRRLAKLAVDNGLA